MLSTASNPLRRALYSTAASSVREVAGVSALHAAASSSFAVTRCQRFTNNTKVQRLANARTFSSTAAQYAVSTTPASSINDPAEEAAQKHMEEGTALIESGNLEKAKEGELPRCVNAGQDLTMSSLFPNVDAIEAYERSLAIKESSSALFNLGVCQYHAKDLTGAIASWTRVIELAPNSSDAHMNIASAFVMSVPPRPDLAIDHLKTAASINPDDAEIQFNLGAVLEACEQLEEAGKAYQRALDGGIARAEMNLRNISAKRATAMLAVQEFENSQKAKAAEAESQKETQ
ncbi:hypothetical protein V8E36_007398 [Tilletia maclaganii]